MLRGGRGDGGCDSGGEVGLVGQVRPLCLAGQRISLDRAREARLVAEAAVDRVRDKVGSGIIGPAATARRAS